VGREDFIEISCRDMEHDCHENVTVGFVIKPVHQNDKWKNADEIAKSADLIIARRNAGFNGVDTKGFTNTPENGYSEDFQAEAPQDFEAHFNSRLSCRYTLLENPLLPISSTEIRARIRQGKSWRYLVPAAVYEYITERGLYGERNLL